MRRDNLFRPVDVGGHRLRVFLKQIISPFLFLKLHRIISFELTDRAYKCFTKFGGFSGTSRHITSTGISQRDWVLPFFFWICVYSFTQSLICWPARCYFSCAFVRKNIQSWTRTICSYVCPKNAYLTYHKVIFPSSSTLGLCLWNPGSVNAEFLFHGQWIALFVTS